MKPNSPSIEDSDAIAAVHVRSWQSAYAHILPASFLAEMSIPDRATRWRAILSANESKTLVTRSQSGEVTGLASFGKCRDAGAPASQGEIWALYASPEVWGQGVGRELLKQALSALNHDGFTTVSLWVLRKNHRGIRFYKAAGFVEVQGSTKSLEIGGTVVEEVCMLMPNEA